MGFALRVSEVSTHHDRRLEGARMGESGPGRSFASPTRSPITPIREPFFRRFGSTYYPFASVT
jgi:hypothetical protein